MAGRGERVTWRLELPGAWGGRLDPAWLPTGGTEGWRRVFEGEDLAARVFSAGGAGLRWAQLAEAAAALARTLAEYRLQWRVAEQIAAGCPTGADRHLAALAPLGAVHRSSRQSRGRGGSCGSAYGDQVQLGLEHDLVALIIPIVLATQVRAILIRRHCPPPMLAHPHAPEHQVLLASERYEVALSWPSGVHRVTTALLLPPTMTPRGPITWVTPPQEDSLRQCREIDIRAAVRAALSDPPPPC